MVALYADLLDEVDKWKAEAKFYRGQAAAVAKELQDLKEEVKNYVRRDSRNS